jgi:hypothetical protein
MTRAPIRCPTNAESWDQLPKASEGTRMRMSFTARRRPCPLPRRRLALGKRGNGRGSGQGVRVGVGIHDGDSNAMVDGGRWLREQEVRFQPQSSDRLPSSANREPCCDAVQDAQLIFREGHALARFVNPKAPRFVSAKGRLRSPRDIRAGLRLGGAVELVQGIFGFHLPWASHIDIQSSSIGFGMLGMSTCKLRAVSMSSLVGPAVSFCVRAAEPVSTLTPAAP